MNTLTNLELNGHLRERPLAELMIEIAQANLNGSLRLASADQKSMFYFDGGELVFAASNERRHRLFELLLRQQKLTAAQIAETKNPANDMEFKDALLTAGLLSKEEIDRSFVAQVTEILTAALAWREGTWVFSPLVRIRSDIRFPVGSGKMLFDHARSLPDDDFINKFKSLEESFVLNRAAPTGFDLLPQEAFILSRFDGGSLSIEQVRSLSGLSEPATFRTLYSLWLGGFLVRQSWNAVFTEEKLAALSSAKLALKQEAANPPAAVEEKPPVRWRRADEPPPADTVDRADEAKPPEPLISLEEYLARVEATESHYQTLGVGQDISSADIKSIYFSLAKRFHPDLFYRKTDAATHHRIQQAFTELAQAYEVLRKPETREVYDYKLRKTLDAKPAKPKRTAPTGHARQDQLNQAADYFEQGFTYLVEQDFEQALPYFASAVYLVGDNARYRAYYGKALAGDQKTFRQAEAELQTAVRIDGSNADYRFMLAELYISIGLVKRAEGELNRLLAIKPDHHEARSLLDSLQRK